MRQTCLLVTALLCVAGAARAQVTVNLQALDALPGAKPPVEHPVTQKPAPKRVAKVKQRPEHRLAEKPATSAETATSSPPSQAAGASPPSQTAAASSPSTGNATPAPPSATLPTAPPADVALAPIAPPPATEPPAPPPPPPISDIATSAATTTHAGLRVTFGAGESDLSPASAAAIKGIVQSAPQNDSTSFNVVAYAAGKPEDPSTARRVSLSRALAVRSALIADGVASSHIFVRALGAAGGNEDPDRVDLAVLGGNAEGATPASAPAPDSGAKSQAP